MRGKGIKYNCYIVSFLILYRFIPEYLAHSKLQNESFVMESSLLIHFKTFLQLVTLEKFTFLVMQAQF
jgi:hypothetical protein